MAQSQQETTASHPKLSPPVNTLKDRLHFRQFLILAFVALIIGTAVFNATALMMLKTRGDTMYPESANILPGMALLKTGQVYPDFNSYPFFASVYGPLFYYSIAFGARIFHSDLLSVLIFGRVLSYVCFVATGWLAYLCARQLGYRRSYAGVAWLGVAFCAAFARWNATFRPDTPAVLLEVAALYFALRNDSNRRLDLVLAGLCVAGAALMKQSIFMAALAIVLWLIKRRRFKDSAVFVVSAAVPVIALFTFLQLREPALQRITALRYAPKEIPMVFTILQHSIFRADGSLLMLLALIALIFGAQRRHRLLVFYFAFSWTLPVAALVQCGGNTNYLLEGWAACALLAPAGLATLEDGWPRMRTAWRAALILFILAVSIGQIKLVSRFSSDRLPSSYGNVALLHDLKVFGDLPFLTANGKDPELPEPFLAHMFSMTGHWSPAPIAARMDQRIYDVIFLRSDHGHIDGWRGVTSVDPVLLERIDADYSVLCESGDLVVLTPNSRTTPFSMTTAAQVLGRPCTAASSQTLSAVMKFDLYRWR